MYALRAALKTACRQIVFQIFFVGMNISPGITESKAAIAFSAFYSLPCIARTKKALHADDAEKTDFHGFKDF
jgi:hypothetical protein